MTSDPVHILLVDDRPENLLALEAILGRPDYILVKAHSGPEALMRVLKQEFAVILLDVMMPGMDGYEVASLIKQKEKTRYVPIIFLTAVAKDLEHVFRGYSVGAVDYLAKPLDADVVKSKVSVFVDLFRKSREIRRQAELLREKEAREKEYQLAELRQLHERKVGEIIETVPGLVWELGGRPGAPGQSVEFVSRYLEPMLGYSPSEWKAAPDLWIRLLHAEDRDRTLRALTAVFEDRAEPVEPFRWKHKSGRMIWVESYVVAARDAQGRPTGLRGVSLDISERKRIEEWQRFLFEATTTLSGSLDLEHTLTQAARLAVPRLASWSVIDLVDDDQKLKRVAVAHTDPAKVDLARQLHARYPPSEGSEQGTYRVISTGQPELVPEITGKELARAAHDEEHLKILSDLGLRSYICVPLLGRERTLGAITLISCERSYGGEDLKLAKEFALRTALAIENATLYKRANEALRARDEFISIASHELKTPLTPLKLRLQMIIRQAEQGAFCAKDAELMKRVLRDPDKQVDRIVVLVDDMLDFSRIRLGRLSLKLEEENAAEVIRDVVERYRPQLEAAGCEVSLRLPKENVIAVFDRFRIEQVFINLLTNAMKYGPGQPVEIDLSRDEGRVRITVRDHGIGIGKQDQARIFDRFERAVSSSNFGGLGLGLYISRQILEAHRGSIRVQSVPGQGAAFTIDLPIRGGREARKSAVA